MRQALILTLLLQVTFLHAAETSCADKDSRCKGWADTGECKSNPGYMLQNCGKSCGQCNDACKNIEKDVDCRTWQDSGFCKKTSVWYGYMKKNCQLTCSFCKAKEEALPATNCLDKDSEKDCSDWKTKGYCDDSHVYFNYMKKNCDRTCGFCGTEEALPARDCLDKDSDKNCNDWMNKGYCDDSHIYFNYMKKNCNKTCGFCGTDETVLVSDCLDKDSDKDCNDWQKKGYCAESHVYFNYMKKSCNKTCGFCGKAADNCKDTYDTKQCADWAKAGECSKNPQWMHKNCMKSCDKCKSGVSGISGSTVDNSAASSINEQLCGLRLKSRVVGGNDAAQGDWPWQVGLTRSYSKPFCGGSLINKQWVVTANHCFGRAGASNISPDQLVIRLAEHDVSTTDGSEVTRKVSKIIRHEDYKVGSYDADIALVKLASPVEYNALIKPVCLPDQDQSEKDGMACYVTGWGRLQESGKTATLLQEAKIPIISRAVCNTAYGTITENMICAGFEKGGIDACQGDSGGPFVCSKGGRFQLTGVVSFGRGCARANAYGVYAKVSKYVNWIKKNIKE